MVLLIAQVEGLDVQDTSRHRVNKIKLEWLKLPDRIKTTVADPRAANNEWLVIMNRNIWRLYSQSRSTPDCSS